MNARRVLVGMLLLGSLILSPAAAAKAFRPGDVSVCSAQGCVSINNQSVLNALAAFYYDSAERPMRIGAPRTGTPSFKLEFSNGYVSGIAAGSNLERFRSGGVNIDQFRSGVWYRLPSLVSSGLRRLVDSAGAGQGSRLPWLAGIVAALMAICVGTAARARRRSVRLPTMRAR